MLKRLAIHVSNYSFGNLLVLVAGVISFPIFTRIFSVDEYGILNLIGATLTLLTGIAKLGQQHSVVRFYGEIRARNDPQEIRRFYSTVFFGMVGVGAVVAMLWAGLSQLIPAHWWNDSRIRGLFLLTAILVLVRVADSCLSNLLRAEERSRFYSTYSVIRRYAGLAVILFVLFFVATTVYGFFVATVVTETLAVFVLMAMLWRRHQYSPVHVSPSLLRAMLAYGIPMIGYEIGGTLLSIGDRYVIQYMLGSRDLGLYSAGYNLCEYLQTFLIVSIGQAVMPMYVRTWAEKGEKETVRFVRDALRYYLMLGLPIVAGLSAVGEDLLVVLASEKYRQSASVIPYVMSGMVVDGTVIMLGAGVFLQKRTMTIAVLVAGSALVNLVLTIVMVPRLGIVGAAVATFASYSLLAGMTYLVGRKYLAVAIPWHEIWKYTALAVAMYGLVTQIRLESGLMQLVCRMATGAVFYGALVVVADRQLRSWVASNVRRFRAP